MLYDPDWLSLLDARERLKVMGAEEAEAETAICLALGDRKLRPRWTLEKMTYAPTGAALSPTYVLEREFKEGIKLRLAIPADLKPADIDWDNSRPLRPWPYGPWQYRLLAHVAKLMISRATFGEVFPLKDADASVSPAEAKSEAHEEASPPKVSERRTPGKWARKALNAMYDARIPSQDEVPNNILIDDVTKFAKDKGWTIGGRDTILRAAKRRK